MFRCVSANLKDRYSASNEGWLELFVQKATTKTTLKNVLIQFTFNLVGSGRGFANWKPSFT